MNPTPNQKPRAGRWLAGLILVVAVVALGRFLPLQEILRGALQRVANLGAWGPVLFVVLYVLATVFFLPGSILTLGAGAVFGVVWGSVYVSIGSTLGATAAFLVGRHLTRDAVERRLSAFPRFAAIDQAVAEQGWRIVGLARLSPVFPFALLNYAFGITRVRLGEYVLASWIGMMPGTVLYVYVGSLAQSATGTRVRTAWEWSFYAAGLAATVLVTVLITRMARRALDRSLKVGSSDSK